MSDDLINDVKRLGRELAERDRLDQEIGHVARLAVRAYHLPDRFHVAPLFYCDGVELDLNDFDIPHSFATASIRDLMLLSYQERLLMAYTHYCGLLGGDGGKRFRDKCLDAGWDPDAAKPYQSNEEDAA